MLSFRAVVGSVARLRLDGHGLLCIVLLAASPLAAADWPCWRGPHANGSVTPSSDLEPLPEELPVAWRRSIGGGYSGPVVSGKRIWVHSRRHDNEIVTCLDLDSGEVVWTRSYASPFEQDDDGRQHGRGPYASPALKDGRLFTFGTMSVLSAWRAESGELLWRRISSQEFDPGFPYFGAAASPVVWKDLVFVHLGGHARGRDGSPFAGAMVGLRAADGSEVWRWEDDGPALGATPVLAVIGDRSQLVFKTMQLIVGVEALTGQELWRIPFRVSQDNTIVTPLVVDGCLITSDYDWGVGAWNLAQRGSAWAVQQRWRIREVSLFLSSPVMAGGMLVGFSHRHKGELFLLDPDSGEVAWKGDGRRGEHATLIARGDHVLVFGDDGMLTIARVEKRSLRRLHQYRLGRAVGWSHPAVVGERLVFRDGADIAVVRLGPASR